MGKAQEFLDEARKALASATSDVAYRNVIVSAYYGAFHAANEFEELLPFRSDALAPKGGVHDKLCHRLERPAKQLDYALALISKDIGAQLRMLKALREIASYEIEETVRIDQAEDAVLGSQDILKECSRGILKINAAKP